MRCFGLLGLACLGCLSLAGCSESAGFGGGGGAAAVGGSGGAGGVGGRGGAGGVVSCDGVECSDRNECTDDTCDNGACRHLAVEDGTPCGYGVGTCQLGSCVGVFACSEQGIREAIEVAGGPHTFDCDGPTTVFTEAEIGIVNDVVLEGEGLLRVDGADDHRVFSVPSHATAELRGFEITGGFTTGEGAGIDNRGTLTLIGTTVSQNHAQNAYQTSADRGVTGNGGGIANDGDLTLADCVVSDNAALHDANNVFQITSQANGGGIINRGRAHLERTTVADNTASNGGGIMSEGVGATLTLVDSSILDNTAFIATGLASEGGGVGIGRPSNLNAEGGEIRGNSATSGGGLAVDGGAMLVGILIAENTARGGGGVHNEGTVLMRDCTVSGHSAQQGAGIESASEPGGAGPRLTLERTTVSGNSASVGGGGIFSSGALGGPLGELNLINSTVSGNSAGNAGGGIWNYLSVMTMVSCTVAQNDGVIGDLANANASSTVTASIIHGDCSLMQPLTSGGHNIESPGFTCGLSEASDQQGVTAEQLQIDFLQDNGGPTMTHALLAGSVAIDVIPIASCGDDEDQRGEPRPGGASCDVGAFELQP